MKTIFAFTERTPFARPLFGSSRGDGSIDIIHLWVGKCLSAWEWTTEAGFANVYSALISSPQSAAAARSYAMMTSVSARKNLLYGASEAFFTYTSDGGLKKELRDLLTMYGEASTRRNDIAHGVAQSWNDEQGMWYFVGPALHSKARDMNLMPTYSYSDTQLEDFAAKFDLLGRNANKLSLAISGARAVQNYLREASLGKPQQQHPQPENG